MKREKERERIVATTNRQERIGAERKRENMNRQTDEQTSATLNAISRLIKTLLFLSFHNQYS